MKFRDFIFTNATNTFTLAALTLTAVTIISCGGKETANTLLSSTTPGTTNPISPSTSTLFSLSYSTENSTPTSSLHETSSWSKACSFSSSDTSKDLTCNLEIAEKDLYFNNLKFTWNAPVAMCAYVEVTPYWYFNYKPFHLTGSTPTLADVTYTYDLYDGIIQNLVQTSPATPTVVYIRSSGGVTSVRCAYDHSWYKNGPNCCEGTQTYTITTKTTTVTSAGTTVTTTVGSPTTSAWGGRWANCASGPATDSTNGFGADSDGWPKTGIYYTLAGASSVLNVKSPLNMGYRSNVWAANYNTVSGLNPLPVYQPSYYFGCFSASHQRIGSITLYVREWNSTEELAKTTAGDPTASTGTNEGNAYRTWYDFNTYTSGGYPGLYQ